MLKQEINSLEIRKLNSNRTLQDLRKQISTSRKALDSCVLTYGQQIELQSKKVGLEDLVKGFEKNNEEYLKIKQTIKQEVSSILSNAKAQDLTNRVVCDMAFSNNNNNNNSTSLPLKSNS